MEVIDAGQINDWYKLSVSQWGKWRENARKGYKYYMGDQWSPEDLQRLKSQGRPALTINRIKPTIRTLSGYMRQNRRDQKVMPRRGGVQAVADIYTHLMKHTYDLSYADWYNAQMFTDGIICGKGFVSLDIDYMQDPVNGQLTINREDPFLILEDPFSTKYDLSDARFVFRMRWLDKSQLEAMYPKAKDHMNQIEAVQGTEGYLQTETDDYDDAERQELTEIAKHRYLVKECWYRTYQKTDIIIDPVSGELKEAKDFDDGALELMQLENPNIKKVSRIMPKLHLKTMIGEYELDHQDDPYNGMTRFPIVRFADELVYAEKAMVRGEIDDIISAQDELNKRRSQALHLLNTTANSGYLVEEGALSPTQYRKLEEMGSKAGVIIQVKQGALGKLQRVSPNQLSTGHVDLAQLSDGDIKSISGINSDLLGVDDTTATSGIAMEMRRRQGLINVEPVFDNFDFTMRVLGDTMLDILRNTDTYSVEEIAYIVGEKNIKVDGKPLAPEQIMQFLQTQKGKYGMTISDQESNPTQRRANFQLMLQSIKELGLPVPQDMIIKASDFPFREELLEMMEKAQQVPDQGAISDSIGTNPNEVQNQAVADMVNAGGLPV